MASSLESSLTLRDGLERYYLANPDVPRGQDIQVGWLHIPWQDLQKHDIMHVVTGYSTALKDELQLIGFLLTALTWKRPWYFYLQSLGVFAELLGRSLLGRRYGADYYWPWHVCRYYRLGIQQGLRVRKKIDAYLDPELMMDRSLTSLRQDYGIRNAGAWD
ncbi:MAG: hypothetical protein EA367_11640 [Leptolyngbya sp. DLM2.Bin15]|nr:MAG: hypothetical protein EA367_11640 [Leptolyngbya sp. DLM2.Bin15]